MMLLLLSLALAILVTLFNFYLVFLRFPLHKLRGGTRENFRFISVFPLVSTLLCGLVLISPRVDSNVRWTALVVLLIDPGGIPCAVVAATALSVRDRLRKSK